jgi:hypothetical protein
MFNVMELCFSLDRELSTQEESAPKVSGWQRIMMEIITMLEALTLDDVA